MSDAVEIVILEEADEMTSACISPNPYAAPYETLFVASHQFTVAYIMNLGVAFLTLPGLQM